MANKELRYARRKVHELFDPIWRDTVLDRTDAYQMLADGLGLELEFTHISQFDLSLCYLAIAFLEQHHLKGVHQDVRIIT